jgi:hypothetical protein
VLAVTQKTGHEVLRYPFRNPPLVVRSPSLVAP